MKNCDKCGEVSDDILVFDYHDKTKICENCVLKMYDIVDKKYSPKTKETNYKEKQLKVPSIDKIISHLNKSIIGQYQAKETLAVAVRNHYKRLNLDVDEKSQVDKTNILLMGNSGTGKTQLVKSLSSFLDIPIHIVDTSSFTSAGYVGQDVDEIVKDLYEKSGNSIEKTQKGIIFLDEIDKKRKTNNGGRTEPGGEQAQQSFLKLVEGKEVKVKSGIIDTSNILFIAAGAFVGIDSIIDSRINKKSIGFSNNSTNKKDNSVESIYDYVSTEDLITYGMIPELIGRFPVLTYTNDLTKEDIKDIIKKPKNSVLNQFKTLFHVEDNLELDVTTQAIDYMSDMVIANKIGVRGVRKVFEQVLRNVQINAENIKSNGGVKVQISKNVLMNNDFPIVYYNDGKKRKLNYRNRGKI